jgi:hypothetical protein
MHDTNIALYAFATILVQHRVIVIVQGNDLFVIVYWAFFWESMSALIC